MILAELDPREIRYPDLQYVNQCLYRSSPKQNKSIVQRPDFDQQSVSNESEVSL